jgi:two-component system, OmpR family, sensor histidine kinase KdpD
MEAARQNEQLKSILLDALAHEFKTPLTSVKAATTTYLSSTLSPSDRRELVAIVDEEADRMNRLVSDSIELARIGSGPIDLHRDVSSPDELIIAAVNDVRGLLEEREIKVEISPGLPPVLVDQNLSKLALRQILTNAFKYSPRNTEIRVRTTRQGKFVVASVSDLGPGIGKPDQERIFERFYRGPEVRARIPGTGMGLSIAREIIEAQGGVITLQSQPGEGATFSLTFPVYGASV